MLSSAMLAGASQQLRNMATGGGNLLQRTRCPYFYDLRRPATSASQAGCSAIGGLNRMHAILGTSDACIAVHPSDMCVALAVLEAKVHVTGPAASERLRSQISTGCRATRRSATPTQAGEMITAIELPARGFADELHIPEDSRPALLCVRAGVGRGRSRIGWRQHQRGAFRARRRCS